MQKTNLRYVIIGLLLILAFPSANWAEIKLTVAETSSGNSLTAAGLIKFAELVRERSNGEIVIEIQFDGGLGKSEKSIISQVQLGAIDMARSSMLPLVKFNPALSILDLPYLWKDQEHEWKILMGEIGQKLLKDFEISKFYGLCYYEAGARSFYNAKREMKTITDLRGLRIQVARDPLMIDFMNLLGASAIPMAPQEVYEALRKRVIDGAENDWLTYVAAGHYEVAQYYTVDQHSRVPEILIASKLAFDKKLKPDQIALVKQAAQDSQPVVIQKWNEREVAVRKSLSGKGNIITKISPESRQEFLKAVKPLYETYGAQYRSLIESIQAQQ
jgi:tripartite ATP-independent transporter DctP family solute receptor